MVEERIRLTEEGLPELCQLVIFSHGLKNILQQHLLLGAEKSDISVARQPL